MLSTLFALFVVGTIAMGVTQEVVVPAVDKTVTYTQEVIVPSAKSAVDYTVDAVGKVKDKVTGE